MDRDDHGEPAVPVEARAEEHGTDASERPGLVPPERRVRTGTGLMPAVITSLVVAVAVVVFVAQNGHSVAVEWLWMDFDTSPAVLVLGAVLLGILVDEVVGLLVRRARRRRINEREELERLRSVAPDA